MDIHSVEDLHGQFMLSKLRKSIEGGLNEIKQNRHENLKIKIKSGLPSGINK